MKEIYKICHGEPTGNGEQRIWRQIGIMIIAGKGKISIKLNSIPVVFDGWLQCFPAEKKSKADKKIQHEAPKSKG